MAGHAQNVLGIEQLEEEWGADECSTQKQQSFTDQ